MTALLLVAGLILLVIGAEGLVRGASRLAAAAGVSPLVIGLTVVAYGTSTPELVVSVASSWSGRPDLALGNVVGSNIFNVLFILGISALITPLAVSRQLIRFDVPLMVVTSVVVFAVALDGRIGQVEGALLVAAIVWYTIFLVRSSRRESQAKGDEFAREFGAPPAPRRLGWAADVGLVVAGLAMLVLGSRWLVTAAIELARAFGLSELIIGLTIVAAGTSLPEVATSIIASLRGERDIAVGNVVGSNIFNLLAVLGFTSVLSPGGIPVSGAAIAFDLPVMIAVAVACLPIFFSGNEIARWEGGLFFAYYGAYVTYLILAASQHDALGPFSVAMGVGVLPLTVVTLGVIAFRGLRRGAVS